MILFAVVVCLLVSSTIGQDDVIYPSTSERLAMRISCQVREPQQFRYSSITELWGLMGGQIKLDADVILTCMGDDRGGKYESQALKYRVELDNLKITENRVIDKESLVRHKRGVGDFFSKSWDQVKQFFKRVFGRKTKEPEITQASHDETPGDKKGAPEREDPVEDFNMTAYNSLYSKPFQFVQLANGSIPEIRFAENEIDGRVKNFKRHLIDAFSTQLNSNQKSTAVVEKSVMGEHTSVYNVTVSGKAASLSVAGFSSLKAEQPTVVVKKLVTEDDILQLAPSEAVNDREKMDLKVEQMQVFQGGRMISSSGISSLILLPKSEKKNNRMKREDGSNGDHDDITTYIHAHSTFDIQLQKRTRRSTHQAFKREIDEHESYTPASRMAEIENNDQRRLRLLQESNINASELLENLLSGQDSEYGENMQALFEMVEREVSLDVDKRSESISNTIRKTLSKEVIDDIASKNFSVCKDFLQLLALAGGSEAETIFLSLLTAKNRLSEVDIQTIVDIISDLSRPSSAFLHSMGELFEQPWSSDTLGAICLSLGHLASKATPDDKSILSGMLTKLLKERQDTCRSDPLVIDVLEAIGNLDSETVASNVLEVSALCKDNGAVQIACAHALRHSVHLPQVQGWIRNLLIDEDCEIIKEVIGSLMDKIQDQEMKPGSDFWPRHGFNEIDQLLKNRLETSRCSSSDVLLYFHRKKNSEANVIAENYYSPESEPWNAESRSSRQKRAAWDDLNCQEWTEDSKFTPIQDKKEFASDRETYNKRKSCLAFRRLGVKDANAEIHAGMFAGVKEPSDPPKYKLFTKFVSGLNFLGHQMEIGSFYFYHQSGKTKAYVRIMGRTRQEFTHEGCTPTDLRYRPLKHIPLYMVNIATVQLSLGIHLSSQLAMDTACPEKEVYQLEPLTSVRIGGEAMGTILFSRGAVNLSGNFNYKLQFTFTPAPDMCLKGSHGYDPMNISFETYYQFWNAAKNDWGRARTWKPSFLSWDVTRGDLKQWFADTCIGTESSKSSSNSEREVE